MTSFAANLSVSLPDNAQIKRRTELYLRALWNKSFSVNFTEAAVSESSVTSYLQDNGIFVPASLHPAPASGHYHRAAATHASLHAIYSTRVFDIGDLNLMQRTVINLVEDLRVELLAIKKFPGLKNLWLGFHKLTPATDDASLSNASNLLRRLSRSVLDPNYLDTHQWVIKGSRIITDTSYDLNQPALSLQTGLLLANDLGQMRLPLNSGRYEQAVLYRDDNRSIWQQTTDQHEEQQIGSSAQNATAHHNRLKEADTGIQLSIGNSIDPAANNKTDHSNNAFFIRQQEVAAFEYNQVNLESASSILRYPEWDYRTHVLKNNWCTLHESIADAGDIHTIDAIFNRHKFTQSRLRQIARQLQIRKQQRIRKLEVGDEIDIDPFITAQIALRCQQTPDTRVFMQFHNRHTKNLAISILMDLSESTNTTVSGSTQTISELMCDAVLLLADTLDNSGENFAINGFSSNGRHDISLTQFKTFSETFADSKHRLSTVRGSQSTRLGAAIRHCALSLGQQTAERKLLLVITDGAPSDIDVFDPAYLEHDSWHAVSTLSLRDIKAFCISLDANASDITQHIFGKGQFETLDDLRRLPEVLSQIYLRYLRH